MKYIKLSQYIDRFPQLSQFVDMLIIYFRIFIIRVRFNLHKWIFCGISIGYNMNQLETPHRQPCDLHKATSYGALISAWPHHFSKSGCTVQSTYPHCLTHWPALHCQCLCCASSVCQKPLGLLFQS